MVNMVKGRAVPNPRATSSRSPQRALPGFEGLLAAAETSPSACENIRQMLKIKRSPGIWRGQVALPAGSFVDIVVGEFRRATDIPLEVPAMAALSLVAARLLNRKAQIDLDGQIIEPSIWSVVLAESGAGKSLATNTILRATGQTDLFPNPASSARFVADLHDHNRTLWVRDEFGQFMKSLEQQTHMAELKDYMLRLYDNKEISRNTKASTVSIEDPALVVLGLTVFETFKQCVSAESMVDGFAQRFNFLIARRDPTRRMEDFPLYKLGQLIERTKAAWDRLEAVPMHDLYKVSPDGMLAFEHAFKTLRPTDEEIPASFFRRLMFSAVRYALVFHLLLEDQTDTLTGTDFAWAGRLVALHLDDARALLDDYGLGELERLLLRAEKIKAQCIEEGRACTARDLVRNISGIATTSQARGVLALISET